MVLKEFFGNPTLMAALAGWTIAQTVKVPLEYLRTKRWNWALLLSTGGMPSSHTTLVTCIAHGVGLRQGFDSLTFAVAVTLSIVVIYDATGIRRQAGRHAALINVMIQDLASGHPLKQELLREVLGHTPLEALGGILLGLTVAQLTWMLWG